MMASALACGKVPGVASAPSPSNSPPAMKAGMYTSVSAQMQEEQ